MADTWGDAPSTGDAWGTGGGGGGGGGGGATGGGFGGSGGYNMDDLVKEQGAVDWSTVSLSHFSKDFYRPTPQTAGRSKGDIEQWRNIHKVTISGAAHKVTGPILTFKEADLPHYVMDQIRAEKFVEPTPIQAQAWPVILAGHDLVGIAKTGSGKTLAFGIPMVIHMRAQPALGAGDGPIALCMAPTRELATQIEQEFQKILRGAGMRSVCCYGGQGRRHQEGILRAGVHAVVATAGRLLDFLKNQATNLRRVTYLVIDEADRMLDMGFEPQVRGILSQIRPDRQSLLFSATWPREVEALASDFLTDYVKINIGYEHLAANTDVRQHIWFVEGHDRLKELLSLIMQVQEFVSKMLIFCKTKTGCDECVAYLRSQRIRAFVIHGDKTQEERESTLQAFRDAESSILVATDVAQRGLDIRSLQAVVNLDFPDNLEDYVHRIGRTGRAGEIGDAYTFFTPQDKHHAQGLVEILEEAKQPVDPFLRKVADEGHTAKRFFRYSKPQGGGGGDWGGGAAAGWSGWKEGDWQQGQGDWKEEGGAPAASGSPKHTSPKAASPKAEAAAASGAEGGAAEEWKEGGEWKEDWGEWKEGDEAAAAPAADNDAW